MTDDPSVPLRDYVEALLAAQQRLADERHAANQRAVDAAITAVAEAMSTSTITLDKRLDALNELRDVVTQIMSTLITRPEFEAANLAIVQRLEAQMAAMIETGRVANAVLGRWIGLGLTGLGVVITLVVLAANAFIGK